jgi:hypothetical protein
VTLDLGAASDHSSVTVETGMATVFSSLLVGCRYAVEVVAAGGRLFAARITSGGRLPGDVCLATEKMIPQGLVIRGWMAGLPAGGASLPPASRVDAVSIVPIDRGTSFAPVPFGFPTELIGVRTADAQVVTAEFTTHVSNRQLMDLHVLPDGSEIDAWTVRDAPTLRLKGTVTEVRNQFGEPVSGLSQIPGSDCEDPRVCAPVTFPGQFTLELGTAPASGPVTLDVRYSTVLSTGLCSGSIVAVEVAIAGGVPFAKEVEGSPCPF